MGKYTTLEQITEKFQTVVKGSEEYQALFTEAMPYVKSMVHDLADNWQNIPNTEQDDREQVLWLTLEKVMLAWRADAGTKVSTMFYAFGNRAMHKLWDNEKWLKRNNPDMKKTSYDALVGLDKDGDCEPFDSNGGDDWDKVCADLDFEARKKALLTPNEQKVAYLLGRMPKQVIAKKLGVSAPMISKYERSICKKMGYNG